MKITVKKLQGGECSIEVEPTMTIAELKRQVAVQLNIPVEEQKLLLAGRTLADEQQIGFYPTIKEGSKLNLVVKKPEGLFEVSVKFFKNVGCSEKEAIESAHKFLKIIEEKIYQMSWDDFERLCHEFLLEENGEAPPLPSEQETDCDDSLGL